MTVRMLLAGVAAAIAVTTCARAEIVTIDPAKDNTLFQNAFGIDLSNGSGVYLFTGATALPPPDGDIRRALIQFDIAGALPARSTINGVSLRLHMSKTIAGPQPVDLHRLLIDWGEGASDALGPEGGGIAPAAGDATWTHTFFDSEFWQTPGGDFSNVVSGTTMVAGNGSYTWESTPELVADVQLWLDAPSMNFGWLLRSAESVPTTAKRFDSRENGAVEKRPKLTIDITLPPGFEGPLAGTDEGLPSGTEPSAAAPPATSPPCALALLLLVMASWCAIRFNASRSKP